MESGETLTEPIARKNENVPALPSMYCDNVGSTPRGPAPPLRASGVRVAMRTQRMTDIPQDAQAPEDKAHGKANTRTHGSTHPIL